MGRERLPLPRGRRALLALAARRRGIHCVPASTVSHDYHLTMFPELFLLLERNRGAMLSTNLHLGETRSVAAARSLRADDVGLLLRGPSFIRAKFRSYRWIAGHRDRLRERRHLVESLRRSSDWGVLRRLHWGYPLDQFLTLGRERGHSERNRLG